MNTFNDIREFTIRLDNGKSVTANCEITMFHDGAYGADADGNRGVSQWLVDEIAIDTVEADDDGNELNEQEYHEAVQKLEDAALNYEWDC